MSESLHISGSVVQTSGAYDDIVRGWCFMATMQRRTPAAILRRHLEFWPKDKGLPPNICPEGWEGVWLLETEDWRELLATLDTASDVGPVPADGGDYLPFLLALHGLSAHGSESRFDSIQELIRATGVRGTPHTYYVERLGGIPGCIGLGLVRTIFLAVGRHGYPEQFWAAGFRTIQSLIDASDHELCSVHKFSKTGLKNFRRAIRRVDLPPNAEYV